VALTSTPQTLFIVPTMLIRQLLFLGFYRLNALLSRTCCRAIFVHKIERSEMHKNAAQYVSDAATCYVLFELLK
jgi:hypothetical protein